MIVPMSRLIRPILNWNHIKLLLTVAMWGLFAGQFLVMQPATITTWRRMEAVFWIAFAIRSCLSHEGCRSLQILGLSLAVTVLPWIAHAGTVLFFLPTLIFLQVAALATESRFAHTLGQAVDQLHDRQPRAFRLCVYVLIVLSFAVMYSALSEPTATPFQISAGNLRSRYRWFGCWDQGAYYYMAKRMACGEWFPGGFAGGFYYGPGYPILGVPFYFWLDNPFLPQMLITYLLVFGLLHRILSRFLRPSLALSGLAFLLVGTPLSSPFFGPIMVHTYHLLIPWNNSLSILASIYFVYLILSDKPKNPVVTACLAGSLFGFVFAARYGDILFLFPLVVYALVRQSNSKREFLKLSLFGGGMSLIPAMLTLWLHSKYYGKMTLTYLDFADLGGYEFFWPTDLPRVIQQVFQVVAFSDLVSCGRPEMALPLLCVLPVGLLCLLAWPEMKGKHLPGFSVIIISLLASLYYYGSNLACHPWWLEYNCLRYLMPLSIPIAVLGLVGVLRRLAESTESTKVDGAATFRPVVVGTLLVAICLPPLFIPKQIQSLRDQLLRIRTDCQLQPCPDSFRRPNQVLLQLRVPGQPNRKIGQIDLTDAFGQVLSSTANGTLLVYNDKLEQLDFSVSICHWHHPGLVTQDRVLYVAPTFPYPPAVSEIKAVIYARDALVSNSLTISPAKNKRQGITLIPSRLFDVNTREWAAIYQSPWIPVRTNQPVLITANVKIHRLEGEMYLDFSDGVGKKGSFPEQHVSLQPGTTQLASVLCLTQEVGAVQIRLVNLGNNRVEITDLQAASHPVSAKDCNPPLALGKPQAH